LGDFCKKTHLATLHLVEPVTVNQGYVEVLQALSNVQVVVGRGSEALAVHVAL
jgi:hypothetical protein